MGGDYPIGSWTTCGSNSCQCVNWYSEYTADTGWTKLNDSIQEYRESF